MDLIHVPNNEEMIFPSPKLGSRFDVYTCRPADFKNNDPINWALIVVNGEEDSRWLIDNHPDCVLEMDGHNDERALSGSM